METRQRLRRGDTHRLIAAVANEYDGTDKGCRDWPGALNSAGYPERKLHGRMVLVSHCVLTAVGLPRPDPSLWALHSCDRPVCFAPWHLRWGTPSENVADARDRCRTSRGEAHPSARLTEVDVAWIRTCGWTLAACAARLDVGIVTVSEARRGVTWSHVAVPPPTPTGR